MLERLGLAASGGRAEEEERATRALLDAAVERLDALVAEGCAPAEVSQPLRDLYQERRARLRRSDGADDGDADAAYARLRNEVIAAQRAVLGELWDDLDPEVARQLQRSLDHEQSALWPRAPAVLSDS